LKPLILVSNDDGIEAPGLRELAGALDDLGEVMVVAPDRERSAQSHALSLDRPLRVVDHKPGWWAVDGTPADCVYLALLNLLPRKPSLVASGINRGYNLGSDLFYSGTVAAAVEAAVRGAPAFAISMERGAPEGYTVAGEFARALGHAVLAEGLPPKTLLNVNVPPGTPSGVAVTIQGRREHEGTIFEGLDPRRRTYYWIEEGKDHWISDEMSDIHAVRSGLISITPLQSDTTHHATLTAFRAWEAVLKNGHRG